MNMHRLLALAALGTVLALTGCKSTPDATSLQSENEALRQQLKEKTDALEACAPLWVNVEIKNDPTEPDFDPQDDIAVAVIGHLVAHQPSRRILISSFRRETIDRCHALAPDIATAWLTMSLPHYRGRYRVQLWLLILGVIAPWIGNAMYILGWTPIAGLDITPVAFSLTGVCFIASVFSGRR